MLETMDYDRLYRLVGGGHRPYLCQRESNWRVKVSSAAEIPRICDTQSSSQRTRHAQSPSAVPARLTYIQQPRKKKNKTVYSLLVVFWFPCAETAPKSGRQRTQRLSSFPSIRWLPGCGKDIKSRCDSLLPAQFSSCRGFRIDHRRESERVQRVRQVGRQHIHFFPLSFIILSHLLKTVHRRFRKEMQNDCASIDSEPFLRFLQLHRDRPSLFHRYFVLLFYSH